MTAVKGKILERYGLDKLKDDEKRVVLKALLESIAKEEEEEIIEVPEWHWEIIKERIAEADANPGNCISLSELRKKWAARR